MNRIVSIILILALGMVFMAMPFVGFADTYEGTESALIDNFTVQVFQHNTSYAGYSNQSGIINGPISYGILKNPQSLAVLNSSVSTLNGNTLAPDIEVDISSPSFGSSSVVYVTVYNAFGSFGTQSALETYFSWSDAFMGYIPRTGFSGTFGYYNPASDMSFSMPVVGNRSATWIQRTAGADWSGTGTSIVPIGNGNPYMFTPQLSVGNGTVYDDFFFNNYGGGVTTYRINLSRPIDASVSAWATVRLSIPKSSAQSAKVTGSATSRYIHSAVFVPFAVAYDTSNFSDDVISAIDGVVNQLVSLGTTIHTDFTAVLNALGSGNITVISGISSMLTQLQEINSKLSSVTGNRYSSAIQYIEYYLNQVLSNTNTMVQQLNDITSTLSSIASTIQATNEQAEELTGSAEEVHEQEQVLFEQANSSIGSTVIGSFAFDPDTSAGMGRVGIDFTNLWNALGNWHNVYIFSMTLTLAFTIIRFTSARVRSKNRSNKSNEGG